MAKNIKVAKYRKLAPVSGNNVTNEPSSRQLILGKFDTDIVRYLDTSISIPSW